MNCNIWKCKSLPLPELLSFIVDNRGKTVPTSDQGHILIATNCVRNENLYPSYEKVRYLTEETYQNWFRAHPLPGDILFVCKGTPGRSCMVPDPINFCIAQDMVALRVNPDIVYNKYLLAVLRSYRIQKQIESTSVGDVIPHFKKSFFDQLMIPLPPMEFQKIIGDYYFAFSYKIECNRKINDNLEQQAQALFKSWFVDFEPFKDGKFVELGSVIKTTSGGTPSRKKLEEYYTSANIKWVKSKELNCSFIVDTEEKINDKAIKESSAKILPKDSVLIAMYGATVGEYGIINESMACNQAICALLPNDKYPYTYLYMFVKNNKELLINKAVGSAQQNISQVLIKQMYVSSDVEKINKFHLAVLPLFESIRENILEINNLSSLRDTLLPKLMSGEINVIK